MSALNLKTYMTRVNRFLDRPETHFVVMGRPIFACKRNAAMHAQYAFLGSAASRFAKEGGRRNIGDFFKHGFLKKGDSQKKIASALQMPNSSQLRKADGLLSQALFHLLSKEEVESSALAEFAAAQNDWKQGLLGLKELGAFPQVRSLLERDELSYAGHFTGPLEQVYPSMLRQWVHLRAAELFMEDLGRKLDLWDDVAERLPDYGLFIPPVQKEVARRYFYDLCGVRILRDGGLHLAVNTLINPADAPKVQELTILSRQLPGTLEQLRV